MKRLPKFLQRASAIAKMRPMSEATAATHYPGGIFRRVPGWLAVSGLLITGCSDAPTPVARQQATQVDGSADSADSAVAARGRANTSSPENGAETEKPVKFKPLRLNARASEQGESSGKASADAGVDEQVRLVISHLQPLQILLGQWRGTTRREFQNFKAVDSHEWVWDLRTDPSQPALTIRSDKSPYVKAGKLTWDTKLERFVMLATDSEDRERRFFGDYSEAPHEITGSDDKQHRVFRLVLNEERTGQDGEQWQLAISQQENNRYLLEVGKRRGTAAFARYDTVSTQRDGTSFALSDTDYAEKACIISEGLGTMELTWKGRSYWVCCSGCRAAFEEEPDKWIARAAQRTTEKK